MRQKSFLWICDTYHKRPVDDRFFCVRRSLVFALDDVSAYVQTVDRNKKLLPLVGESYIKTSNVQN